MPDNADTTSIPNVKTRTIAIFGAYDPRESNSAYDYAYELGKALGSAGFEVLNGGYDGTMKASAKGAQSAGGRTIGMTCPADIQANGKPRSPNPYLDEIHPSPDLITRIERMMHLSGGYIVLDGGTGTLSELGIVWEFVAKGFLPPRPIILAGRCWDNLYEVLATYRPNSVKHLHKAESPEDIVAILEEHAVHGTRMRHMKKCSVPMNDSSASISTLKDLVDRFVDERQWQPYHDPKNLAASIAIEAAELMEHFQWMRTDELAEVRENPAKMQEIGEELADILAYTLSFATTMNIDLSSALSDKMKKNALKYPIEQFRGKYKVS